jgi:hypothetical protein
MTNAQKLELMLSVIVMALIFIAVWWWRVGRIEDCMEAFGYTYEQCRILVR